MISVGGDAELGQLVGLHPDAQRVLAAEDLHARDARDARQFVLQIDDGVIGEKVGAVFVARRRQADQHQRRRQRLLHGEAGRVYLGRKLRLGLRNAKLGQHLVGIRIGLDVEIHVHGRPGRCWRSPSTCRACCPRRSSAVRSAWRRLAPGSWRRRRHRLPAPESRAERCPGTAKSAGSTCETTPIITVRMAMTMATMGRRMKNFDMVTASPSRPWRRWRRSRSHADCTGAPSLQLLQVVGDHQCCRPSVRSRQSSRCRTADRASRSTT